MAMQISKDLAVVHAGLPKLALRLEGTCEEHARLMRAFLRAMADGSFDDRERRELALRTRALIDNASELLGVLEAEA